MKDLLPDGDIDWNFNVHVFTTKDDVGISIKAPDDITLKEQLGALNASTGAILGELKNKLPPKEFNECVKRTLKMIENMAIIPDSLKDRKE